MRDESVSNSRTWHDVRCHSEAQITMESSLGFLDSQFWRILGFSVLRQTHMTNLRSSLPRLPKCLLAAPHQHQILTQPTQRICHSATELRGVLTKSLWPGMKPQFVQEIPGTMQYPPVTPAASSGSDFFCKSVIDSNIGCEHCKQWPSASCSRI